MTLILGLVVVELGRVVLGDAVVVVLFGVVTTAGGGKHKELSSRVVNLIGRWRTGAGVVIGSSAVWNGLVLRLRSGLSGDVVDTFALARDASTLRRGDVDAVWFPWDEVPGFSRGSADGICAKRGSLCCVANHVFRPVPL